MKFIILFLISLTSCSNFAFARFTADVYQVAHLNQSMPMCVATQIVRVQECIDVPTVCKAQGKLCYVQTNNANKYALVCNPVINQIYSYCE